MSSAAGPFFTIAIRSTGPLAARCWVHTVTSTQGKDIRSTSAWRRLRNNSMKVAPRAYSRECPVDAGVSWFAWLSRRRASCPTR